MQQAAAIELQNFCGLDLQFGQLATAESISIPQGASMSYRCISCRQAPWAFDDWPLTNASFARSLYSLLQTLVESCTGGTHIQAWTHLQKGSCSSEAAPKQHPLPQKDVDLNPIKLKEPAASTMPHRTCAGASLLMPCHAHPP